jgi:hypothetical protein
MLHPRRAVGCGGDDLGGPGRAFLFCRLVNRWIKRHLDRHRKIWVEFGDAPGAHCR